MLQSEGREAFVQGCCHAVSASAAALLAAWKQEMIPSDSGYIHSLNIARVLFILHKQSADISVKTADMRPFPTRRAVMGGAVFAIHDGKMTFRDLNPCLKGKSI